MVRFTLDDLDVFFPYPSLYPEQFSYMCELKSIGRGGPRAARDAHGHGQDRVFTRLVTAFQHAPDGEAHLLHANGPEMEKCLAELKR